MTGTPVRGRILVGVDGSAASAAAVRWAVQEARLRGSAVHLVCAYHDDTGMHAPYAPWSPVTTPGGGRVAARAALSKALEIAHSELPSRRLTAETANELPVRALLSRAADAEMLVLGSSRPAPVPGQPDMAVGPVARDCLRLASCPVVVVTAGLEPASREPVAFARGA